ncbi:hypothetical protein ARMSODRAFT_127808 [Armillaria solidipes]|uniref:Uncharacterized protein n=1 Tax=Armillaria solidipes TaxID=1076256 RepID=A0A2H3C4E4_9AGAR|nr:hypothetical protein ARMSODRAFT_127808 [Armillaria solidipes]
MYHPDHHSMSFFFCLYRAQLLKIMPFFAVRVNTERALGPGWILITVPSFVIIHFNLLIFVCPGCPHHPAEPLGAFQIFFKVFCVIEGITSSGGGLNYWDMNVLGTRQGIDATNVEEMAV